MNHNCIHEVTTVTITLTELKIEKVKHNCSYVIYLTNSNLVITYMYSIFTYCLLTEIKMSFLFGRRKTPQEMLRQNQRALNKAMRDLDRERQHMEQQEKKIIADIKKMAKQGQMV